MSRLKGPGAIRFLDVTGQDDVTMRAMLWRGGTFPELQGKLTDLYTAQSKLILQRSDLSVRARPLLKLLKGFSKTPPTTLPKIKEERTARAQLREIQPELERAKAALRSIEKQIEETQKQMERLAHIPGEPVLGWQERAVFLMTLHKCLSDDPDADHTSTPAGSTITARELQKQLHDEEIEVGLRQLRRFMRKVGALASEQGKRTDLQ